MSISALPMVNALLNTVSAVFLTVGFRYVRRGHKAAHRNCMLAALTTSTAFLISYLIYHANAGRTYFTDPEWFRPVYLAILLTHTILAAAVVPLVLATVYQAARKRFDRHKKIARWTWPIWMYVSVTGVVIYALLYHIFPQSERGAWLPTGEPVRVGLTAAAPMAVSPMRPRQTPQATMLADVVSGACQCPLVAVLPECGGPHSRREDESAQPGRPPISADTPLSLLTLANRRS
jgi:uncharacterized membrane protein YozB (DUF420 family)